MTFLYGANHIYNAGMLNGRSILSSWRLDLRRAAGVLYGNGGVLDDYKLLRAFEGTPWLALLPPGCCLLRGRLLRFTCRGAPILPLLPAPPVVWWGRKEKMKRDSLNGGRRKPFARREDQRSAEHRW